MLSNHRAVMAPALDEDFIRFPPCRDNARDIESGNVRLHRLRVKRRNRRIRIYLCACVREQRSFGSKAGQSQHKIIIDCEGRAVRI